MGDLGLVFELPLNWSLIVFEKDNQFVVFIKFGKIWAIISLSIFSAHFHLVFLNSHYMYA